MKKKKYINTINLPKINFPMKANLNIKEPLILKKWIKNNLYFRIKKNKKKKKKFIIHDGPPYANGDIHIGHAYNKILKDIIIKYKNFMNFNIYYTPGWDCHGLPIEVEVIKKNKINYKKININTFKKKCYKYVNKQIKKQKKNFIELGILGNWKNYYKTMDYKCISNTILTLKKIIKLNLLERKYIPTNWCINCKSSLADAETIYYNKKTISTYILFKLYKPKNILDKLLYNNKNIKEINLIIWTTTTWTIPGNCCITIHPHYNYSLITLNNKVIFIILKNKVKEFKKKINNNLKEIKIIKGSLLKNNLVYHPISNKKIPIIINKEIDIKIGTGIIHIASEHGEEDYKIAKKNNIKGLNVIDENGKYIKYSYIKDIEKLSIWEAEKKIIKKLKSNDKLFFKKNIIHKYPFCWRHKTPIIIRSTPQWFINLDKNDLRKKILKNIKKINWFPIWGYRKMKKMIINRPDWCISRQRKWGTPITIFINKKTKKIHPKTIYLMNKIAKKIKILGPNYWFDTHKKKILGKEHNKYNKVLDILDVWFDSGATLSTIINEQFKKKITIDICLEGSDQFRGWFMSLLIINVAINNKPPYKNIISHGFIVNKKGEKMSKSSNNNINPQKIIKKFGADIIRLWASSINFSKEIHISNEIILRITELYRKIRNTVKFLISNLEDFNANYNIIKKKKILLIDKWIIHITKKTQKKIINLYNDYKFYKVIKTIINFCTFYLSSIYFDIVKDRKYTIKKFTNPYNSAQITMWMILESIVKWIAPILSFTADEIWQYIPRKKPLFVYEEKWFDKLFYLNKNNIINYKIWKILIKIKNKFNQILEKKKKILNINNSLKTEIILYLEKKYFNKIKKIKSELKFLFLTSKVIIEEKNNNINIFKIKIYKTKGKKCNRCWHYVDKIIKKLNICKRCKLNIFGKGENRKFI